RAWGDFDVATIKRVGKRAAVNGFIGALAAGKLTKLIDAKMASTVAPMLEDLGINLENEGLQIVAKGSRDWIIGQITSPVNTTANVIMDVAIDGKQPPKSWGDFYDRVASEFVHSAQMGAVITTLAHGAEATRSGAPPPTEHPTAAPAGTTHPSPASEGPGVAEPAGVAPGTEGRGPSSPAATNRPPEPATRPAPAPRPEAGPARREVRALVNAMERHAAHWPGMNAGERLRGLAPLVDAVLAPRDIPPVRMASGEIGTANKAEFDFRT